jgi:hypothetical protein
MAAIRANSKSITCRTTYQPSISSTNRGQDRHGGQGEEDGDS